MNCIENIIKGNGSIIKFSDRDFEILNYISEGLTNDEIANKFNIGRRTFEELKSKLIKKTGAKNIPNLTKIAIKNKWIKV